MEELAEGQAAGLEHGVVEQRRPPQEGVFPEQDAVDARQPLLRGVVGLQLVLPAACPAAPGLLQVVDAPEVMRACGRGGGSRNQSLLPSPRPY